MPTSNERPEEGKRGRRRTLLSITIETWRCLALLRIYGGVDGMTSNLGLGAGVNLTSGSTRIVYVPNKGLFRGSDNEALRL